MMGENMFQTDNKQRLSWQNIILVLIGLVLLAGMFLPAATGTVRAQEEGDIEYTIRPGDTLYEIAKSFDTTIETLLAANPDISDPDYILAGDVLVIPSADLPPRTAVLGPTNGPPGSTLEVRGKGYQPGRALQILFGPENADAVTIKRVQSDDNGHITAEIIIPQNAVPGEVWVASIRPLNAPEAYLEQSNTFLVTDTETQEPSPEGKETLVYLIDPGDQGEHGELIGCDDSLVPVILPIEPDADPIRATLENLFELEENYGAYGLYNSLYQSDLSVDRIDIDDKTAYLYLSGDMRLGGVCDEPRFKHQIMETVNQFPDVSDVIVFINEERVFSEEEEKENARSDSQIYTVQPNDVLSHIAVSFRTTVPAIMRLNPEIERPSYISVGQQIAIPGTDDDNPYLQILPTNGEPGTTVTYQARNLLPHRHYTVGIGLINSEYDQVMDIVTDKYGVSEGQVSIPAYAEIDEYWVVVLDSAEAPDLRVISNLFEVE
jgi:LysM repeat protein